MQKISVKTPFNVSIFLQNDILLRRVVAYFIDLALIVLYFWGASIFFEKLSAYYANYSEFISIIQQIFLLPGFFYTLILEVMLNGKTVGKKITGIKVVKINGYFPNFIDYFIRWIFRIVEIYPFIIIYLIFPDQIAFYFASIGGFVAFLVIIINKNSQRLGDIIAGTVLIKVKEQHDISITIMEELDQKYKPTFPQVVKLSDNDMRLIKEIYENAVKFDNFDAMSQLKDKVETVMGTKVNMRVRDFIETVIKDYSFYTQNM
jgi:uncharacterized RDD family membrane protein YckC